MEKKRCFVIMPFSLTKKKHPENYWTKHFEKFLKPLIEEDNEIEAYRSAALREDIVRNIITSLVNDPIVVADLTDYNPNVLWELGVRQSFRSGTITIAEKGTKLPFNINTKGTLFYSISHIENEKFKIDFQLALKDCLENPNKSDSIVLDTISGRGTITEIIQRDVILRQLDGLISELEHNIQQLSMIKKELAEAGNQDLIFVGRLSISSLVLLITSRFLDLHETEYKMYRNTLIRIELINNTLATFDTVSSTYYKRFEDIYSVVKADIQDFLIKMKKIRVELVKTY